MLRAGLAQLSLSSMKSAGACIGRPVLLSAAEGRQEVSEPPAARPRALHAASPTSARVSSSLGPTGVDTHSQRVSPPFPPLLRCGAPFPRSTGKKTHAACPASRLEVGCVKVYIAYTNTYIFIVKYERRPFSFLLVCAIFVSAL